MSSTTPTKSETPSFGRAQLSNEEIAKLSLKTTQDALAMLALQMNDPENLKRLKKNQPKGFFSKIKNNLKTIFKTSPSKAKAKANRRKTISVLPEPEEDDSPFDMKEVVAQLQKKVDELQAKCNTYEQERLAAEKEKESAAAAKEKLASVPALPPVSSLPPPPPPPPPMRATPMKSAAVPPPPPPPSAVRAKLPISSVAPMMSLADALAATPKLRSLNLPNQAATPSVPASARKPENIADIAKMISPNASTRLKKSNVKRSPGGTPMRPRYSIASDASMAGEIARALQMKFSQMQRQHIEAHEEAADEDDAFRHVSVTPKRTPAMSRTPLSNRLLSPSSARKTPAPAIPLSFISTPMTPKVLVKEDAVVNEDSENVNPIAFAASPSPSKKLASPSPVKKLASPSPAKKAASPMAKPLSPLAERVNL